MHNVNITSETLGTMEEYGHMKRLRTYTDRNGQIFTPVDDKDTSWYENDIVYPLPSIDLNELLQFSFPSATFIPWRSLSLATGTKYRHGRWFAKWRTSRQQTKGFSKPLDLSERLGSMQIDDGYGSMPQDRSKTSPHWDLYGVLTAKDRDGDILLNICIISEQTEIAIWIINLSPSSVCVNTPNRLFQTPLHLAVITEQCEVVRRLMVAGANLDARDARGNTALHIACQLGLINIIEILLEPICDEETSDNTYDSLYTNPNLELRNCDGVTCFHIAALRYDLIMMELLASKGSNINAKELKSGKTPLHMAVESGDIFVVNFLLNLDQIDVNCRMYNGTSAVELAYYLEYHAIVLLLHEKGATDFAPVLDESESESDYSDSGSDCHETLDYDTIDDAEFMQSKKDAHTYEEEMEEDQKHSGISEEFKQRIQRNLCVEKSEMETESKLDTLYLIGKVKPETLSNHGDKSFIKNANYDGNYDANYDGNYDGHFDLGYDSD